MTPEALDRCLQPGGPLRPTFCNVPEWAQVFLYISGAIAVAIFAYGLWQHYRLWLQGTDDVPARNTGEPRTRLGYLAAFVLGQKKTVERRYPGVFHSGIFYGFVLLFIGTVLATVDWDVFHLLLDSRMLAGTFYLWYEFVLDTAGLVFTVGLFLAMWRRYVVGPHHVLANWDFALWSLLIINVTGFAVEGLRLGLGPVPWAGYSWVGTAVANAFYLAPDSIVAAAASLHLWLWLFHAVAAFVFIAAIPYTNLVHLFTTSTNAVLRSTEPIAPGARLQPIDIETAETYGVGTLTGFTWKQRLGFDACLRCGRCEVVCPAYMSGTPLNPKRVIMNLAEGMRDDLDLMGSATAANGDSHGNGGGISSAVAAATAAMVEAGMSIGGPAHAPAGPDGPSGTAGNGHGNGAGHAGGSGAGAGALEINGHGEVIIGTGNLIEPDALWACTTCMACVEACPAFIEIVDDIVDMRRHLTLMEGELPGTAGQTLRNMMTAGNPWGYPQEERTHWAEGIDVPRAKPGEHYEFLYFVGCSASYDRRNQSIARAVASLLNRAGVSYAIMEKERCNSESGRRLGEEYLYQTAAEENIASMGEFTFDRVVSHCPHCFNTIKNEYPDFGGDYEVVHHTQLIRELVAAGKLPDLKANGKRVAFHDSCYLGRYNGEFEAPRDTLRAAGVNVVELPRRRENGLCCGGGGGKMWFEGPKVKDVGEIRMEEAMAERPDVVGVACPFCLTMLDSARKSMGVEDVAIMDVAEVFAEALGGEESD